ncbi:MAG: amino acid adenylation domain-containing protein [Bacteroidota bacterium]
MTDKTAPDLADSMRALLEQELMAAVGITAPAATPVAGPEPGAACGRLEGDVIAITATALRMAADQLDPSENLANFGVDSIAITEIMVNISRAFGISVAPTTFFEARNLTDLTRILRERYGKAIDAHYAKSAPPPAPAPVQAAEDDVSGWLSRHRAVRRTAKPAASHTVNHAGAPIAVIAMEGRFPQSPDVQALEAHLRNGDDCITEVPADRWDWRAVWGDPRKGPFTDVKYGGFVDGVDQFDAAFFNIAPHEAELMDPQHRLFMECVWSLIERAGHAPGSLSGKQVGLFLGINLLDYTTMVNRARVMDAQQMTGLGHAFCANRLSFLLDIHGPSQVVDTACSSSAVALHRAVMSIRHEGCEMAIAGGANLMLSPDQHVLFSQVGMLSPGGRCKSFSRHADGYARSDGIGAVLLKRLDLAERDGDPILGVIRASVESHGGGATSLTAPNPKAQARLVAEAHRQAGIDPRSVTLIECHGTGTVLGDPVEIEGLKAAFAELYRERGLDAPATPHCGLGSIKSNIGHAETAAGIAGLIKLLLAMQSGIQYRSLHCDEVNPQIQLAGSPFHLLQQAREWTRPVIDGVESPRRAGLSSFGAGGTNVHVVVEEYRPASVAAAPPGPRPLVVPPLVVPVSARGEETLRRAVAALRPLVASADLDDLAYTLQVGRDALRTRVAFVVRDNADLARQMDAFLAGDKAAIAYGTAARKRGGTTIDDSDAGRIAARWVAGDLMDWQRLYDGAQRRRLSLPPTPFEHKRFWLETTPAPAGFDLREAGGDRWRVTLTGTEFFLADHRLNNTPVLPGVAYLELARAVAARAGLPATSFRNVVWVQPLMVTAPTTVEISLDRAGKRLEIASLPGGDARVLHAQIRLGDSTTTAPSLDLAALRQRHDRAFSAAQVYDAFDRLGLNYGPTHRAIAELSTGPGPQVLARLTLPAHASTLDAYPLHPSLMDGAFQAALGMALAEDAAAPGAALPFAIDSVDILGPCAPVMWVHIRAAAQAEAAPRVRTLDLDLADETGAVRVRLRGFATRLPAARNDVHLFAPHWRPLVAGTAPVQQPVVLHADSVTDPALPLERRFVALAGFLLRQAQTAAAPIQLVLRDGPDAGMLAGTISLLRSAGQEAGAGGGQVLIVPPALPAPEVQARLAEAAAAPAGAKLRLEDGRWWQEAWEPVAPIAAPAPWRDGQVILVTGGLGGLGRLLTAAIRAAAPNAIIVLAGRSQSAEARDWLAVQGPRVEFVAADLADAASVAALVDGIRHRHGRLDGIIHAAGVLRDAPLARKTPEQLAEVLAPKVAGTLNLDRAIGDAPLDFFVLFSSISAVLGNAGQADYAAANGFMDGFAAAREVRRRAGLAHGRTVAIAWPLWAEGGMTIDEASRTLMTRTTGLVPLAGADGLAALATALAGDAPRLLVAAGDGERLRRRLDGEAAPAKPAAAVARIPLAGLRDKLLASLITAAARQLKVAPGDLAADEELTEYGFDSIGFTQFTNALNDLFDLELTPTVFFEHPTLAALSNHLGTAHGAALAERLGVQAAPEPPPPTPAYVPVAIPALRPQILSDDPVAIIGMSGIFPGAADVDAFWANLEQGRDCISEVPPERWDWRAAGTIRHGGFIDGIDGFDGGFFGLSAPEARMMDPQQRLLLTQAFRLFEDAGIAPRRLAGSDTGVFIGIADTGYGRLLSQSGAGIEGYAMTGLAPSLGPNRISYHFNLHGPSVAVETACSSALVAVHRAVEAIRAGSCEAAIAGGINTLLLPDPYIGFAKAGMLSPDGRCKTFADTADGYVRGEGVGLVLLKRLSAARRDGDRIVAVIRASGENHGGRAGSLTAPNPKAQADLLRATYARAGFDPRSLGYIEAHGTGTKLGDPIEVEALRAAFADLTRDAEDRFGPAPAMACGLGSVKSNIGHLELASGIAGLIKVLLQMRHGTLVRTLHCDRLNPYLKLDGSPFQVMRESRPWTRALDRDGTPLPRRAGVSSFGFGGANAHVVVEEVPAEARAPSPAATGPALLVLSAHSAEALAQSARDLRDSLARHDLADIAFTLQTTRDALEHRLAFTATSAAEAVLRLDAFLAGSDDPALHQGRVKSSRGAVSVLESDPEVARAIAGLAARGRADGLLEIWVKGFAVDWTALYGAARPQRVTLPGYPLAATRYWVRRSETPTPVPAPVPQPVTVALPIPEPDVEPEADDDKDAAALAALSAIAARVLEVDASVLDPDAELGEFGFDSITMTGFATKVNAELNLALTPADFFEFATLNRLARHIAGNVKLPHRRQAQPAAVALPVQVVSQPIADDDPIAIVGFSCRFPQALDGDAFWDNLLQGRDCISRIPAERWDWRAYDGDPKLEQGKTNVHWGGFIDGVFEFDPLFFGISPREAKLMDPQQRLLMMHVWKAIEDAGHAPRSLAGRRVGLFVGTSSSGYREIIGDDTGAEGYVATGAVPSVGPNRISYFLDWHGPSEPVETACSSSLVALHRAVQGMRAGDCDMAVVGGVNTIVTPEAHINFAKAGMLSLDGRCKTFSAQANGYVRGEGIGVVVLKRLSEAERDGDPILALVRATAVNHGGRANSLTAPNTAAQAELLREAQARAGIDPATIGYIEAHGTGTALGDPVEINALKSAFATAKGAAIGIGAVKSNIGHLELAAGIAGIIKVLQQMRHRTLAPSLHCAEINPYVDLSGSPFHIVRDVEDWRPVLDEQGRALPLRAGISSFGFGGVNAHVILEEYRAPPTAPAPHAGPLVVVLSARDGERLKDQVRALLATIEAGTVAEVDLPDLAYTLAVGRDAMKHRLALVVDSLAQLRQRLAAFLAGDTTGMAVGKLESGAKSAVPVDMHAGADAIAAAWATGGTTDWAALYPETRRRLRLPSYPFARDVYHINATFSGSAALVSAQTPTDYTRVLNADDFVLRDHRVNGARILPGAMGLELARAAFAGARPFAPIAIRRVVWQHPLRLDSGSVIVRVPLDPAEDGASAFRLISGGPDSTPHMLGRVAPLADAAPTRLEREAVRARCGTVLTAERLYARYAALGLDYGPAFQAVAEAFIGEDEVLARLVLPAAAAQQAFGLHPSLVDAAFQAALGLFPDDGTGSMALPFGLDVAEVLAPTTATMWAHVRRGTAGNGIHRLDIDLADDDGAVRLRLRGFTLRILKAAAPTGDLRAATLRHLSMLVAQEAAVPLDEIEAEAALEAYGIDSVMIVRLTEALERDFGPLPKTLFFEYRTLAALTGYFVASHGATLARLLGNAPPEPPAPQGGGAPRPQVVSLPADGAIAIIGMAGRYPGADDLAQFWRNLDQGRDCITEVPAARWDHSRFYDPKPGTPGKTNSKWGGFVDGFDRFDPLFFNIAPREAEYMDPQERLFLQCAWETLENAGYTRATLPAAPPPLDGAEVGVFVGVMYEEYQLYGAERTQAGQPLALSSSAASIANRVSSFCGFHGPSLAVDSMCSSSLSAIHLACESLRAGSCRVALAGGVNLTLHPNKYLALAQGRFMSSSGRCESFGKGGDGYVPGEGVGAVLLKPLANAEADGDRILGVIRASALNHGGHTNGYTVPNPAAQAAVIGKALDAAGIDPRRISYVEAHGTGTSLGDPIEIAALTKAYAAHTADTGFCAIGSVKSNIGHCESASGVAGLAKVLLQFQHRRLVPSLHSAVLNPGIDFARTPFVVQQRSAEWRRPVIDGHEVPRLAGLSSFGAGGANAHLILEEYQAPPSPAQPARRQVFPLSARDPERLAEAARRLRAALDEMGDEHMAAIAWTLQSGREAFEERRAIVAASRDELIAALDTDQGHRGRASRGKGPAPQGDADTLAAAWVTGFAVDWAALWGARHPTAIALPGYPFARERYWVPGSPAPAPTVTLPLLFAPRWQEAAAQGNAVADTRLVVLCDPPPEAVARLSAALAPAEVVTLPAAPFADIAARLLDLLQHLFRQRPERALVQVAVAPDSPLEGLAGMLRSARQERKGLRCQLVTLDLAAPDAAARLNADQGSDESHIRHESGCRLVRRWQELKPASAPAPWRAAGVYLITGGAGGVGRHVCDHILSTAPQAQVWLVGRSALPADLPPRVHYHRADVTDGTAMAALVGEITARHGRLNGVIHAAGLTRDMLLVRKSEADLRAVLAPKVAGTLALDAATAGCDLDVMLLFASVSGALGNAGQCDYAAANAFLDHFAEQRNRMVAAGKRRGRTLSIDWPYWRDGGMRLGDEVIAGMERAVGARPLDTAAALAALAAAVAMPAEDQVLVLDGDHDRLRTLVTPAAPATPTPATKAPSRSMAALVTACFSEVLKVPADKLAPDAPLDRFGMDSVSALEIVATLERQLGPLPPTILFEHPTIAQLSAALAEAAPEPAAAPVVPAASGDIAIIAVAGRYPGADSPEDLWTALVQGRDLVTEVPADRFDPAYAAAKGKPGASYCKWGGFLADVDRFDAGFFGYSPRAADLADPQERLFLETTWHLLERAGHTRARLRDAYGARVGVFVGAMYQHYAALDANADDRALLRLNSYAGIANRVSFFFDLQGPSVAVDSMCSSGLQAVHQACQSLRTGECRLAIAGGVNLSLVADKYVGLSRAGLVGSSAASRSFADGDGYLPAEGVGAVLLKPLADALRDGDNVVAVIKSSAANHGGHSAGFGVPSAEAQARLIEDNIRASGVDPRTIGYVEAAANGAALGDAIELRALSRAFRAVGIEGGTVAIGTVKSNMGHAEAASGMAQLTKVLLQLQHRQLAPTLMPATPNRALDFAATPFRPQWQAAEWPAPVVDGVTAPRRAAISSFGAGGSNVHLVIEEAPPVPVAAEFARPRRFPVSARTPEQLAERLRDLAAFVRATPDLSLARLSHTLRHGREAFEHAVVIVASDRDELAARLAAARPGDAPQGCAEADEDMAGPPLVLPPYPFARERHWLHPAATPTDTSADLRTLILDVLAAELGAKIEADAPFATLGLDSMAVLRLGYAIEEATGIRLDRRDVENHPSPARLAAHLTSLSAAPLVTAEPAPTAGPWRMAMTEGQKGLWVLHALHPESDVYNVPVAFRASGLDHVALGRACRWLLDRYPILTARVEDDSREPMLVAIPEAQPLRRVEVPKGMDPLDFARRRAMRPFDLAGESPCRMELLHGGALGDDHEIVLLVVHHMVFDGASAAVVAAALWDAYGRFASGTAAPPAPDTADFAAFGHWEQALLTSPRGDEQRQWWREQLAGDLPVIALPADRSPQPGAAIDGRTLEQVLDPALAQAAKHTAARLGVTPASLLLAVLAVLVYRHAGQGDMVIGVPSLRRPGRRFERSVGYFVNMLAVRAAVAGDMTAAALVRDVHRRLIEALDHGDIPFAAIAREVGRSLHGEPPYQIGFAYQNFPLAGAPELPARAGHAAFLAQIRQPGDGPFGLEVHEESDTLRLVAGYDGARFDAATVSHLLDRFVRLTAALCDSPDAPVRQLEMMAPAERKRLSGRRANPPALPRRPGLVAEWIAAQAKAHPDAIAVVAGAETLSYRRLVRRANRLARYLRQRGVRPGDAVAVLLNRNGDSIAALLACLTLGAVWVPLDTEAPPRRLAAMVADCAARAVLSHGALPPGLAPADAALIDLDADKAAIAALPGRALKGGPKPGDAAYMIYTSGSTGAPKGVVVSQRALADHVRAISAAFGLGRDDVVLHFAPQVVDTALEQILPTLAAGARLLVRTGATWSPDDLRRVLAEQRVSVADLPPAYLREVLLAWDGGAPPDLRLLIVGGEALAADTVRLWQGGPLAGVRLLNAYGPTEATVTCLVHDVDAATAPGAAVPIGRPLPGTRIAILDRDGNAVPEGVIGELHVGGSRLAQGYHNRPDLTAQCFVRLASGKRMYRTGDLASFLPGGKGAVAFHGRVDHQVKIRGFRVELSEVEAALGDFGLREAVVVPRQDAAGNPVLVAYVVPAAEPFDEDALRAHMAARLPAPMLPTAYVPLAALPATAGGKLDRAALPEPHGRALSGDTPRDGLEETLRQLWAKVLGCEAAAIGIHDDFLLCGGHSLAWVRLLAEIGRTFACRPSAADFLAAQTIAEQARVLRPWRQGTGVAIPDGVVPLRPASGPAAAPLFLVHGAAGTVSAYVDLARRLDPAVPVYGLQAPGADDPAAAVTALPLPEMAARHIAALRRVQKRGPYALAGWSLGGVLAFEMARQLRQAGEKVALLCLIDSYTPAQLADLDAHLAERESGDPVARTFLRDVFGVDQTVALPDDGDVAAALMAAPALAGRFVPADADRLRHLYALYRAHNAALMAYVPAAIDIPVTLLRAEEGEWAEQDGWEALVPAGLTVQPVPGDHASVLQPPNLDVCAARLGAALARRANPRRNKALPHNGAGVALRDPA